MTSKSKTTKTRWTCKSCGKDGHQAKDCPGEKRRKTPVFRGWKAYASIIHELRTPQTVKQLAERLECAYLGLAINVRRMGELGLIREREWTLKGGNWTAIWCSDCGIPAPHPIRGERKRTAVLAYRRRADMVAFVHIMQCLREGTTLMVMEERTGCGYNNLRKLVQFCEEIGFARVSGWEQREDGAGRPAAVWSLGSRPRAPRPPTLSRQEIDRKHNQKRTARARMERMLAATAGFSSAQVAA